MIPKFVFIFFEALNIYYLCVSNPNKIVGDPPVETSWVNLWLNVSLFPIIKTIKLKLLQIYFSIFHWKICRCASSNLKKYKIQKTKSNIDYAELVLIAKFLGKNYFKHFYYLSIWSKNDLGYLIGGNLV